MLRDSESSTLPQLSTLNSHPTAYLADVQRLLSLFTQGLAGRYLHLRSTEALTGQFRPQGATTDGVAIYLPESVSDFHDWRSNLGVYRVAILHQLGYYEFGTFEFSLDEALLRVPALGKNVQAADDGRVDLERLFTGFAQPELARQLFMVLEDLRIDCLLPCRFPGIAADLKRVMHLALGKRPPLQHESRSSVAMLLEALLQYTLGADSARMLQGNADSRLRHLLTAALPLRSATSDVYETADAMLTCYRVLATGMGSAENASNAGVTRLDESIASGEMTVPKCDMEITGPDYRGELQPELVQQQLRLSAQSAQAETLELLAEQLPPELVANHLEKENVQRRGDQPSLDIQSGSEPPEPQHGQAAQTAAPRPANAEALAQLIRDELSTRRRHAQRDEVSLQRAFGDLVGDARSFLYDEWDYLQQTYRKGWCRLFQRRLRGDDFTLVATVRQRHRVLAARIEKQLRRIRAEALARVKRVADGDEIDLDQVLEAVVDRRVGLAPDDRVYTRRDRSRREVAAAFLLDMSASTDDVITDAQAPPPPPLPDDPEDPFYYTFTSDSLRDHDARRVIDVEKDALALMSEALTALGDTFAIYGFSGYGRDEVDFYVAKEFNESFASSAKSALAAMKPQRSTRMGPVIRHARTKLQQQDARLKVLIILSDGFPQDCDYGPDRSDHEYGIQDTARALQEAQDGGIATFCITVDQSGHDYLRRMCPQNRYLVIDELESLPDELSKIYRSLTW